MKSTLPRLLATLCFCAGIGPVLAQTVSNTPPTPPAAEAPQEPGIARGLLMQYGQRLILAPCRERNYIEVSDLSEGPLQNALTAFGLAEGKSLYVELVGKAEQGKLQASSINFAGRQARCLPTGGPDESWRVNAADGSWSLVAGGGQMRLSRSGQADLILPYQSRNGDAGSITLSGENAGPAVQLHPKPCQLQSEGVLTGWQAELQLSGQRLQGCGWQR